MSFERMRRVADSMMNNGSARTFGVLMPRMHSEGPRDSHPWAIQTQCLVETSAETRILGRLRFVHLHRRTVIAGTGRATRVVPEMGVDGRSYVACDDGEMNEIGFEHGVGPERIHPFSISGSLESEAIHDAVGAYVARIDRFALALSGLLRVACKPIDAHRPLARLHVRVENTIACHAGLALQNAVLCALIAPHLLFSVRHGAFISLLDPPRWARVYADECRNIGTHPVLAGDPGQQNLLLSLPLSLCDDARVSAGASRDLSDSIPEDPNQLAGAGELTAPQAEHFSPGQRVRVCRDGPSGDSHDAVLSRVATIEKVVKEIGGDTGLMVTLDDDPDAMVHLWYGRFHYYFADEVALLSDAASEHEHSS